jgi:hypothetical protein
MTNPTTYFNWQMPENTSLVTDLPADFEVFGQAVDTDFQDLLGGTTGQVLSKTSGTDLDFTWVDPTAGDITGVTAGTGISGGGTSGTVTVTNSMATAIDAKGDLIAGTADDTFSALAVGANDTVLTADSSTPTGLKWATSATGGMTLLSTTTLSSTSVTLSSIPQTYKNLQLVIRNYLPSQDDFSLYVRMNGDSTASRHYSAYSFFVSNTAFDSNSWTTQGVDNGTSEGLMAIDIYDYTNTSTWKIARTSIIANHKTTPTNMNLGQINHGYNQTSAISSIEIYTDATSFSGTALLYGVK